MQTHNRITVGSRAWMEGAGVQNEVYLLAYWSNDDVWCVLRQDGKCNDVIKDDSTSWKVVPRREKRYSSWGNWWNPSLSRKFVVTIIYTGEFPPVISSILAVHTVLFIICVHGMVCSSIKLQAHLFLFTLKGWYSPNPC